jgi:hypothetical protein
MAYGDTFHPAGTARDVKVRGPVWAALWSLTGIYSIYWFYVTAKDLSEYGKAKGHDLGQNPMMSLMAVLFGWILLFIPPIIAIYRFHRRVQAAQRLAGCETVLNGWLSLIMILVGLSVVDNGYVQSELNKAWAAEGGPVPSSEPYVGERLPAGEPQGDPLTTTTPAAAAAAPAPPVGDSPERPAG